MTSRKIDYCNKCDIQPIPKKEPNSTGFSSYISKNRFKTIYQGQPSNIVVSYIASSTALIQFDKVGNPYYYELILDSKFGTRIDTIYTNNPDVTTNLEPDTEYVVSVKAHYVSGDVYEVNRNETFRTLDKWKVPSVELIYPENRTLNVQGNYLYTPIQLTFKFSPGFPSNYAIKVDETNTYELISTYYLEEEEVYTINIRNDISSNIHVITEYYYDPNSMDLSFSYDIEVPAFLEGVRSMVVLDTSMSTSIDISYGKSPGEPKYIFYFSENDGPYKLLREVATYSGVENITSLSINTNYSFYVQTYYDGSNNTYIDSSSVQYTTRNEGVIQNVSYRATPFSLNFSFDSAPGNDVSHNAFSLDGNGTYIEYFLSPNLNDVSFSGLTTNKSYLFKATTVYNTGYSYTTENTYPTLYEGAVMNLSTIDATGTSITVSYTPFTDDTNISSIPDYYRINYTINNDVPYINGSAIATNCSITSSNSKRGTSSVDLTLDSVNQYITLPSIDFSQLTQWTISLWYKVPTGSATNTYKSIVALFDASNSFTSSIFNYLMVNTQEILIGIDDFNAIANNSAFSADNEWHHFCITYSYSNVTYYLDGNSFYSWSADFTTSTVNNFIGSSPEIKNIYVQTDFDPASVLNDWITSSTAYNFSYTLSGETTYSFANGAYDISASDIYPTTSTGGFLHRVLYDDTTGNGYDWHGESNTYSNNGSTPTSPYVTTADGVDYNGSWIQLSLPYRLELTEVSVEGRGGHIFGYARTPKDVVMVGSNDNGITFEKIGNITFSNGGDSIATSLISTNKSFSLIRMVVLTLFSGTLSTTVNVNYWNISGRVVRNENTNITSYIDDFRFYSTSLTSSQVSDIYNIDDSGYSFSNIIESNSLDLWYKFESGDIESSTNIIRNYGQYDNALLPLTSSTTNISGTIRTYNTTQSIYNKLQPNVSFNISVDAIYSSGNAYTSNVVTQTTSSEASVQSIDIVDTKGDRVDLSLNNFSSISAPDSARINIYTMEDVCFNTIDISYNIGLIEIGKDTKTILEHDTFYRFSVEYTYGSQSYETSIIHKTDNEYPVVLSKVIAYSNQLEFFKDSTNNQDRYFLLRNSERQDLSTFEWTLKDFETNGVRKSSIDQTVSFFVTMSKNADYVFFCPTPDELQIYKRFDDNILLFEDIFLNDDRYQLFQNVVMSNVTEIASNHDGTVFIVGSNMPYFDIYKHNGNNFVYVDQVYMVNIRSKYVSISPIGNICAISDDYGYSDGTINSVFIYDLSNNNGQGQYLEVDNKINNFYSQILTKHVSFNNYGTSFVLSVNMYDSTINHPKRHESYIKYYADINNTNNSQDFSGNFAYLNIDSTKLLIVNDSELSGNSMFGSTTLYNYSGNEWHESFKIWGSPDHLGEYPIYRKTSMNDDASIIAIGEYTYSYQEIYERNGQIKVYEISNNSYEQLGITLLQDDVTPIQENDNTITGDWFGFYIELCTDSSLNTFLVSGTRPKISKSSGNLEGDVFVYKWQNPSYFYEITEWPFTIRNLNIDSSYQFIILSTYDEDPQYYYSLSNNYATLLNQKPTPYFTVYNNSIDISWNSVGKDDLTIEIYYKLYVQNNNNTILDISFSYYNNSIFNYINNYTILDLSYGTDYFIRFSSEYKNLITATGEETIILEYIGFEDTFRTLNESEAYDIVSLNNSDIFVFDILNPGIASKNIIAILGNGIDVSYELLDTTVLDVSFLELNSSYDVKVTTSYTPSSASEFISYETIDYSYNAIITISNETVPNMYISNGKFYSVDKNYTYEDRFINTFRTQTSVSRKRGIFLIENQDIKDWGSSQNIYVVKNTNGSYNTFKPLEIDVSYHVVLYRTNDQTPGIYQEPAYLNQRISNIMYPQYYNTTFYLANHDISSSVYKTRPIKYFSETCEYKIELIETKPSGATETFYESSSIISSDASWNQISLKLVIPQSRKNVDFRIRRMDNEFNNLFVSDVSMVAQTNSFGFERSWTSDYSLDVWNTLSSSHIASWYDVCNTDTSYNTIRLSSNMSLSFWFYVHSSDSSNTVFWLGNNTTSPPTIYIKLDNEQLYSSVLLETGSTVNNAITYDRETPHLFLITFGQNGLDVSNEVHTYIDGSLCTTTIVNSFFHESLRDDILYFGNLNEDISGIVINSVSIYDHILYQQDAIDLYNYFIEYGKYGTLGNVNDISQNRDSSVFGVNGAIEVTIYLHGQHMSIKKDISRNTFVSSTDITIPSTISFWMTNASSNMELVINSSSVTIQKNTNFISKYDANHISISFDKSNSQLALYVNGYLYSYTYTDFGNASVITISDFLDVGEFISYDTLLNQEQLLTAYYNFFNLYSVYDINTPGTDTIYLEYPSGTLINDVSYIVTGFFELEGAFTQGTNYLSFSLSDLSLNDFNNPDVSNNINITLDPYKTELLISNSNRPHIRHSYDNNQHPLTEDITISFELINVFGSYNYIVRNNIGDIYVGDISGDDIDGNTYSGTISNEIQIIVKEDFYSDRRKGYETFKLEIADLNLATLIEIYENFYFTITDPSGVHIDSYNYIDGSEYDFVITFYSTGLSGDFNYNISGVESGDILIDDVSYTSGTFSLTDDDQLAEFRNTNNGIKPIYSLSKNVKIVYEPYVTDRINLPFQISLTNTDLSYVSIGMILNNIYNLEADISNVVEGDSFVITMTVPLTNTIPTFNYHLNFDSISIEDISNNSTGTFEFLNGSTTATKTFTTLKDGLNDNNETFLIIVDTSSLSDVDDLFATVNIQNFIPTFTLSGEVVANEGDTITIYLTANIPDTTIDYTITGITDDDLDLSYGSTSGSFNLQDGSANIVFVIKEDRVTDGAEIMHLELNEYPDISFNTTIIDTSLFPLYDLSINKTSVNEGDSFTVTLSTEHVITISDSGAISDNEVQYEFTGDGIDIVDLLNTSLTGTFILDSSGVASKTFYLRSDSLTEGNEELKINLIGNSLVGLLNGVFYSLSDIFASITLVDTSQGPSYFITASSNNTLASEFSVNDEITISLSNTINVRNGQRIGFKLEANDLNNNTNLASYNGDYYGIFTAGYPRDIIITSIQQDIKISLVGNAKFFFNNNSETATSATISVLGV